VADLVAISQFATAAGTLVLAGATFAAVRSANTAARTAERSLMTALRPLLIPSRTVDPPMKVLWSDSHFVRLDGGQAYVHKTDTVIYLAMGVRNAGTGMAVVHGWDPLRDVFDTNRTGHNDPETFRRQGMDIYVSAGEPGYWEAAVRDLADPTCSWLGPAIDERRAFGLDILYGDQEGGQRVVSRFIVTPAGDDNWYTQSGRHWNIDRPDPR
jgi:hypothetical protein